jgi:hypothetical protein
MIEARQIGSWFFQVEKQPEVGIEAYDQGVEILREFFLKELAQFDSPELRPLGKDIIQCCIDRGTAAQYDALLGSGTLKSK